MGEVDDEEDTDDDEVNEDEDEDAEDNKSNRFPVVNVAPIVSLDDLDANYAIERVVAESSDEEASEGENVDPEEIIEQKQPQKKKQDFSIDSLNLERKKKKKFIEDRDGAGRNKSGNENKGKGAGKNKSGKKKGGKIKGKFNSAKRLKA